MTTPRNPHPAASSSKRSAERLPKRRDDSGLTTLEWLLIVAAVAGLAALAVVLVQNVVGETSEQIAGSSARETAAKIAATSIMEDADRGTSRTTAQTPRRTSDWIDYYTRKCRRLAITYGDAGIDRANQNFVAQDHSQASPHTADLCRRRRNKTWITLKSPCQGDGVYHQNRCCA